VYSVISEIKPNILIIDTEDTIHSVEIIKKNLEFWGFRVDVASSTNQAMEKIDALTKPTIVLLEWNLHDHSKRKVGAERFVAEIFERTLQYIFIVVYSKIVSVKAQMSAAKAGVHHYLFKGSNLRLMRIHLENTAFLLEQTVKKSLDSLTGVVNRLEAETKVEKAMKLALHRRTVTACVFIDLNDFKLINDTYGHLVGDTVLKIVGNAINELVDPVDVASRYGGDEFVIFLFNLTEKQARLFAQHIAELILSKEIYAVANDGSVNEIKISVSVGLAILRPRRMKLEIAKAKAEAVGLDTAEEDKVVRTALSNLREELIKWSDKAMYDYKNGRRLQNERREGSRPISSVRRSKSRRDNSR